MEVVLDAWPDVAHAVENVCSVADIDGIPLEQFFGPLATLFRALCFDGDPLQELFRDCPSVERLWWEEDYMGGICGYDYYTPTPEADKQLLDAKLLAVLAGMEQLAQSLSLTTNLTTKTTD